jgi:putative phosphoribosyl transferase
MDNAQRENKQIYNVQVEINESCRLEGILNVPEKSQGVILFAHGSGSSRHSPRNQFVARVLGRAGLATLLIDLLTVEEEEEDRPTGHLRFAIELLSQRVVATTNWLLNEPVTAPLRIGYFGASTGAAAALDAAAQHPQAVGAVVSRGGRPDLANAFLPAVQAPTLLLVGSKDTEVLALNRQALALLEGEKQLEIVPGASHLFEEAGTLEQVAQLACQWFKRYLLV